MAVDQQCRESNGKVKIMGYMAVCMRQAHQQMHHGHKQVDGGG